MIAPCYVRGMFESYQIFHIKSFKVHKVYNSQYIVLSITFATARTSKKPTLLFTQILPKP